MPAYRFPIVQFQDSAGLFTAALVEDDGNVAAVAESVSDARQQLRDHLEKLYKNYPWYPAPDLIHPKLSFQRVEVRPEYAIDKRPHPTGETIALRVAVVTGKNSGGLRMGVLPTLGIRFVYYDDADLKPLVAQYVQGHLKGKTPAQISRYFPAGEMALDDIVLQVPREAKERAEAADLSDLAQAADPLTSREFRGRFGRAWGRDALANRLIETVRTGGTAILLLGETGVGKSTILADAARRMEREGEIAPKAEEGAEKPTRKVSRFWLTSGPRIIAGMQYLGMWQERVEGIIAQVGSIAGILCAENLLDLVRSGGSPRDSIGAFLMPYLQRGELRLIAEATPAELDAIRRLLPGLADLFQIITVPSFARAAAIDCLLQLGAGHRQNHKIELERGVVEMIHRLFSRFMPYVSFPGKAAAFLSDLFTGAAREKRGRISAGDAIAQFVRQTGLPELFLRDELPLEIDEVVGRLHREVVGQASACRAAAGIITTFKAGLNDPARPLGVLLFAGPTGVGKTQLALSLAGVLFGGAAESDTAMGSPRVRLVRLDMSEYAGYDAAARFIGSASEGPPKWVQEIRRQPFTVLLLDEIEKASPEVFDMLLGVFDEGRLTDPWGRLTHFNSAVIIMTSNLGAAAGAPFGLSRSAPPTYEGEAMGFFRPEFFNRIDAIVRFDPLGPGDIRAIAIKELSDLARREGLSRNGVKLAWSERLIEHLSREGYDPRYGARPLQRAIEAQVVTPLAKYLVEHPPAGGVQLMLDIDAGNCVTIGVA